MFSSHSRTRFEANQITVRDNADRCARFDETIPRSVPRNISREDFPCARLGLHFPLPFTGERRDMRFSQRRKNEEKTGDVIQKRKKSRVEIYPLPQRRERHGVRHGRFRASHGFREGRASGGNRGRRLDGKHIYE